MATDDSTPTSKPTLHPVYTVSNIQHKVRVLDGTRVTYAQWIKLFTLHAKGYKVLLPHIDITAPPAPTDPAFESWSEIDAHVLQWIYGTLSDDLLARVLETESTAHAAWLRVKNIFHNNKGERAAALEQEFTNLRLESMPSLEAYCKKLRDIAGQLNDIEATVTEQSLLLQLVRGPPAKYDTVASYINQALPNFETACSMLQLEQHRTSACDTDGSSTVLVAPTTPSQDPPAWPPQSKNHNRPTHRGGGRRGGHRSSKHGGDRSSTAGSSPRSPKPHHLQF
ncbi:hypothetical protein vseg_002196 [Gypsophila vaccaria]